jgi:CubicO group peptidase (beta-lactamase class C family)
VDGRPTSVVVGGGHWGGGLSATVAHHLALGGVVLGRGAHAGARAVSDAALAALLTPCPLQPVYGGLWWLNGGGALFPEAPDDSVLAMGVGATVVWVAPSHDLVACARWIRPDAVGGFIAAILRAAEE